MSLANYNDHFNESVGRLTAWERQEQGLVIEAENAEIRIIPYSPGIIRIRICKKGFDYEDNPYTVIREGGSIPFELTDRESQLTLQTESLCLKIDKFPVRMRFETPEGKLLNQDDPAFGTSWIGEESTCYKTLLPGERFVGLGEKTGALDKRGKAYTNWNFDYFAYPVDGDPLYVSIPFYMGIHDQGAYGIYFDNTYKSVFNFGASQRRFSSFGSEGPNMDYYFIYDRDIRGIIRGYSWLTGRTPLPPKWCLGYQQCRYSYYPDSEVINVARTFREKKIPADVIYLDIHYMDAYKVFTFHPERFPDPGAMVSELKAMDFETVVIVDPGVKVEPGYPVYDEGVKKDVFAKYPDGSYYEGEVWPGWCHFPDFTREEVREWWGECYEAYLKHGIEGFWNDMNEPATWGNKIPDLVEFDFEGQRATHRKAHNIYGMQMARSTFEGVRKRLRNKRPFVLSRAGFAGIQRYAAIWTGDNVASDEHMLAGIRMINSMGLSGIPYAGYDVGGFAGEASRELYARWIALGAFSPFYRGHSMINSRDAEPWTFGEEVEEIARNYLNLRYMLLPYIYSVFYEAVVDGMPVQRSLAIDYPGDERIYLDPYQNQYFFGPAFLIAPVRSKDEVAEVFLPSGRWYGFFRDEQWEGDREILLKAPMEELPIFVKGGAIIPMQSKVQSTREKPEAVLYLHIYAGPEANSFEYYEDDGSSYEYEKGHFYKRTIHFDPDTKRIVLEEVAGDYTPFFDRIRIYLHGFGKELQLRVNGEMTEVKSKAHRFVRPISAFDPWTPVGDMSKVIEDLPHFEIDALREEIMINWSN